MPHWILWIFLRENWKTFPSFHIFYVKFCHQYVLYFTKKLQCIWKWLLSRRIWQQGYKKCIPVIPQSHTGLGSYFSAITSLGEPWSLPRWRWHNSNCHFILLLSFASTNTPSACKNKKNDAVLWSMIWYEICRWVQRWMMNNWSSKFGDQKIKDQDQIEKLNICEDQDQTVKLNSKDLDCHRSLSM